MVGSVAPSSVHPAGPAGSRDHACITPPPPNQPATTARVCGSACFCLSAHPPTHRGIGIRLLVWCYLPLIWGRVVCNYGLRALVSATLWVVLPFWHCLVPGTPSLSYMICLDLVPCFFSLLGKYALHEAKVQLLKVVFWPYFGVVPILELWQFRHQPIGPPKREGITVTPWW